MRKRSCSCGDPRSERLDRARNTGDDVLADVPSVPIGRHRPLVTSKRAMGMSRPPPLTPPSVVRCATREPPKIATTRPTATTSLLTGRPSARAWRRR